MAKETLVRGRVARGRTVHIGGGTKDVGTGPNARKIVEPAKEIGPGGIVELPQEEIDELRRHGFLEKADGTALSDQLLTAPPVLQEGKSASDDK